MIDGVEIKNMSMQTLHEKIGFIPQSAFLFSGTVADNLRMGKPDATEEEMWEALETAQAADFVRAMPDRTRQRAFAKRQKPLGRSASAACDSASADKKGRNICF